jgi:hypothetical protein
MRRISLAEVMVWASPSARAARVLAATSSRDEVSLQVTRTTQKACGSNSLSRSGAPAQKVIPGPVGQAGRSSDRHLTVGLDVTRRQRASRAEPEQHAGCP